MTYKVMINPSDMKFYAADTPRHWERLRALYPGGIEIGKDPQRLLNKVISVFNDVFEAETMPRIEAENYMSAEAIDTAIAQRMIFADAKNGLLTWNVGF